MLLSVGIIALGAALLYAGAEALVRGAAGLARTLGVSPLLVGLTVVAYGTSMPELVVSGLAAMAGKDAIVLGNVIGSNIFNVLLVLGAAGLIRPVHASLSDTGVDIVALGILTVLATVMFRRARLTRRTEGALLLAIYALFLASLVVRSGS